MLSSETKRFQKTDIVIWNPCHFNLGLGDRLRGFAGGVVVAKALGAKLLIGLPESRACPESFENVFESGEDFTIFPERLDLNFYQESKDYQVITKWQHPINWMPWVTYSFFEKKFPVPMDFMTFRKQWTAVLLKLRPVASIQLILDRQRHKMQSKVLGVHLRRTDVLKCRFKNITNETVEECDKMLWEEALDHISKKSYKQIYLASDDKEYFKNWSKKFTDIGIEVLHFQQNWKTGPLRQTALDGVVVDMYMMSYCDTVLGSVESSLFLIGKALGGSYKIIEPE